MEFGSNNPLLLFTTPLILVIIVSVIAGARSDDLEQQALRQLSCLRQVEGGFADSASPPLVRAVLLRTQSHHQAGAFHRHARLVTQQHWLLLLLLLK